MDPIGELIERQKETVDWIKKVSEKYTKEPKIRRTQAFIKERLDDLEFHWKEFKDRHEDNDDFENHSKGSPSFIYCGGDSNDLTLLSKKLHDLPKKCNENITAENISYTIPHTPFLKGSDGTSKKNVLEDMDNREDYRDFRLTDFKDSYQDIKYCDSRVDQRDLWHQDECRDLRCHSTLTEQNLSTFSQKNILSDEDSDGSRSQSPWPLYSQQIDNCNPRYDRVTMYDLNSKCLIDDQDYSSKNIKADQDMRFAGFVDSSNSDIDLRLPFQPVKNMQVAKEIDGSMSSLKPIPYKIYEVDVPEPKYSDLRQSFQKEDSTDPRLRRILGLPELSNSKILVSLGRSTRPTIASPSSIESSPSPTGEKEKKNNSMTCSSWGDPRSDPRRTTAATVVSSNTVQNPVIPSGNLQQNVEIRMLLQKSEWYKNLNSKFKIMVNQQLALVSTELKRYHQDPSPNKVFDIKFILNNDNLQQILTNLGIYIDDNGQVAHVENDNTVGDGGRMNYSPAGNQMMIMNDSNIRIQHRLAMQHQIGFLRGPPPNMNIMPRPMGHGGPSQGLFRGPATIMPPFGQNSRVGLFGIVLGTGRGGSSLNRFTGNLGDTGGNMVDPNYCAPNNTFSNSFGGNSGHFGGQQMNRGNRNNRPGCGGNRHMQNRRMFKQNNTRDRRGIGHGEPSCSNSGGIGGAVVSASNDTQSSAPNTVEIDALTKQNDNDIEESWDD